MVKWTNQHSAPSLPITTNDIDHPILDLETSVTDMEDLISVLDDDVTELDVLVETLQEENAQLQLTVNLLLQRMDAVEAAANSTNTTLEGKKMLSFNHQGTASMSRY